MFSRLKHIGKRFSIVALLAAAVAAAGCEDIRGLFGGKKADHLSEIEEQLDRLPERGAAPQREAFADTAQDEPIDNWYPDDISPPPGTRYTCPLTALPDDMSGIPADERNYINHIFAMILKLSQSKVVLLQSFSRKADMPRVAAEYEGVNRTVYGRIESEEVPPGLEDFHGSILKVIDYHLQWEREAFNLLSRSGSFPNAMAFPSGKYATKELRSLKPVMAERYPDMTHDMASSLNLHLCALELF